MADNAVVYPKLTAEQRRAAAGQYERANQVIKGGDHDYGLQLLLTCCKIDPSSLIYRKALRKAQRAKYNDNETGQSLAYLRSLFTRLKLKRALMRGNNEEALVQAELIFMRNPWDLSAHIEMARALEGLGWNDHALWALEQVRPQHTDNPKVNRPLARLYEKRGNFKNAIALWELVRRADPGDNEAQRKGKDLAASDTIARGRYEEAIKGEESTTVVRTAAETSGEQVPAEEADPTKKKADRYPREIANLMEKIKSNPKSAHGYLHVAEVYKKSDQYDKAKDILEQGLVATNNNFDVTQALFDLDLDILRQDLAVTEERLRESPDDADLTKIRAKQSKEISTRELEYWRRRSDRFPTDAEARFEMGLRLLRIGQFDEAIKELQTVRNDPRHHGKALFYLGLCFKSRNNWRLAQRNLEEALQHLKTSDDFLRKEATFLLASGLAETGETDRAIELGCELANIDYSYKNIGELVETWQRKIKK